MSSKVPEYPPHMKLTPSGAKNPNYNPKALDPHKHKPPLPPPPPPKKYFTNQNVVIRGSICHLPYSIDRGLIAAIHEKNATVMTTTSIAKTVR